MASAENDARPRVEIREMAESRDAGNVPRTPNTGCSLSSPPIAGNAIDWSENRERSRIPDDYDKRHSVDTKDTNQMIAQRLATIAPLYHHHLSHFVS